LFFFFSKTYSALFSFDLITRALIIIKERIKTNPDILDIYHSNGFFLFLDRSGEVYSSRFDAREMDKMFYD
jgi:hypothetical protein